MQIRETSEAQKLKGGPAGPLQNEGYCGIFRKALIFISAVLFAHLRAPHAPQRPLTDRARYMRGGLEDTGL